MRGVALVLLVLSSAGAAASAGSAKPALVIRYTSPLTVHGAHFQSHELVTLMVAYRGRHEKQVRSTAAGTFAARFRF